MKTIQLTQGKEAFVDGEGDEWIIIDSIILQKPND